MRQASWRVLSRACLARSRTVSRRSSRARAHCTVGASPQSYPARRAGNELRLLRQSSRGRSLAEARPCDDHFSGRCGVPLKDGLLDRGCLVPEPAGYDVSEHGVEGALDWGVDVTTALTSRRRFAQPCLDWTERREHLARALAAALTAALMKGPEPWFVRLADDHRGLRPTELGLGRLAHFGWEPRE
jgi:hypothetical protein